MHPQKHSQKHPQRYPQKHPQSGAPAASQQQRKCGTYSLFPTLQVQVQTPLYSNSNSNVSEPGTPLARLASRHNPYTPALKYSHLHDTEIATWQHISITPCCLCLYLTSPMRSSSMNHLFQGPRGQDSANMTCISSARSTIQPFQGLRYPKTSDWTDISSSKSMNHMF